jgi:hypothetical protein
VITMARSLSIILIIGMALSGQTSEHRPAFADYPVKAVFTGRPAPPVMSGYQRTFRTVIRTHAKSPVEFAGHYTVPLFGCGAGCSAFYIVDSVTGKVYDGSGVSEFPGDWLERNSGDLPDRLEFHKDSRLMRINGCPNETACGYYDYIMVDGKGLKLIKSQLLHEEYQPQ